MEFFTTSDNSKVYYKISGQGIPIIFIHGFSATHDVFRIPQKVLSRKYKCISYDLRGHGLTSKTAINVSINRMAKDLKELIIHLDLENIILVGWSLGGSIIFEYLNEFGKEKISKICLVDTSPRVTNDRDWNLGLYHGSYSIQDANRDLQTIKTDWNNFAQRFIQLMAPELNEVQLRTSIEKMKENKAELMFQLWDSLINKDYTGTLKSVDVETLLLFGEKSTLYSLELGYFLNKTISNSKLIFFENCGHLLILENPIKFNRVLDDFISSKNHSL